MEDQNDSLVQTDSVNQGPHKGAEHEEVKKTTDNLENNANIFYLICPQILNWKPISSRRNFLKYKNDIKKFLEMIWSLKRIPGKEIKSSDHF